jgi:hypothetical protein
MTGERRGNYLYYALGEIVLIVVGILIAFQIDEWNQARKDRAFEKQTLAQIRTNLQADAAALELVLQHRRAAVGSIDRILASDENPIDDDELARRLADIIQFDRFHSLTNAYEVLKSRGLEVIRSDELRLALGQYYDGHVQEIPSHNADIRHAFFETWEPVLHSEFDVFKWQKEARPLNSEAFLANPRYRVILKIQRDNHDGTGDRIEKMLVFNRQVQRLVDTELAD